MFISIIKKLIAHNLPVAGSDRLLLLDELAVQDIISLLKFLTNKSDDLSLAEALRSPLLGLSEAELFQIAYARDSSLFDSLKLNFPNHDACHTLKSLLGDAKHLAPYELIEKILINHNGRLRLSARLGNGVNDILDEFLLQAMNYEELGPPSTFGFLLWLDGMQVAVKRQLQNESQNIRVMTIHGSKGLESPIVIIPDTLSVGSIMALGLLDSFAIPTPPESVATQPGLITATEILSPLRSIDNDFTDWFNAVRADLLM